MNRLIIAFPGAGKTTCVKAAKVNPLPGTIGAMDLDIKCPESIKGRNCPDKMRNALTQYVVACLESKLDVFTHIWAINPFYHFNHCQIIVVVPAANSRRTWTERILRRGDHDFADRIFDNFYEWRQEWIEFYNLIKKLNPTAKLVKMRATKYLTLNGGVQ